MLAALGDHESFANAMADVGGLPDPRSRRFASLAGSDPPRHTRMRKLVSRAFTSSAVARLEGRITAIVAELLDAVAATGRTEFRAG